MGQPIGAPVWNVVCSVSAAARSTPLCALEGKMNDGMLSDVVGES